MLVILASAVAVIAAGLYLMGVPEAGGGGGQAGAWEQEWMRILPAEVGPPVRVYYISNMARVGGLGDLVGGQVQIFGVRYLVLRPSDIEVLVVPGRGGCVADCGGETPLIAVIYQLRDGSSETLFRAMAKSRLLRYKVGNFTVFYSVGKTLTGDYNGDIVSFAAVGDDVLLMVSGNASAGRGIVEEMIGLWGGEGENGVLSDETSRGAMERAIDGDGVPLALKLTERGVNGSRLTVLYLYRRGSSAAGRMVVAFDTEASASAAQRAISDLTQEFRVAGVEVGSVQVRRDGRYYVIEFPLSEEEMVKVLERL